MTDYADDCYTEQRENWRGFLATENEHLRLYRTESPPEVVCVVIPFAIMLTVWHFNGHVYSLIFENST